MISSNFPENGVLSNFGPVPDSGRGEFIENATFQAFSEKSVFRSSGLLRRPPSLRGMDDRSCHTHSVPARREKGTSLRIEDHKVIATANKNSLKKHGRQ
jgi:hypothetical protein